VSASALAFGPVPDDWAKALGAAATSAALAPIAAFVAERRRDGPGVLPGPDRVFAALEATPFAEVRAVILGQDPYPNPTHASGLAFSVPRDLAGPLPRSLHNIHAELATDVGFRLPGHGSLEEWTRHGVLLLNTVLTVDQGERGSHRAAGWQAFTDAVVRVLSDREAPAAFLLWGEPAKAKARLVDTERHVVVASAHPSPLSQRLFLGSRPFSRANEGLAALGAPPVDWSLDASDVAAPPRVDVGGAVDEGRRA
jgi:uracil-DNA glycosylase